MMEKKIFFVKMNLDLLGDALTILETDAERSDWILGFRVGAIDGPMKESWSEAKKSGWAFGFSAYEEAVVASKKIKKAAFASVEARKEKYGSAQPYRAVLEQCSSDAQAALVTEVEQCFEHSPSYLSAINHQPSTINEEQETNNKGGKPPARSARFIPPEESEWLEYCQKTWDDWHPSSIQGSWNYYESVGWMAGKSKIKDWRATARNAHNTAKQYGKLQPKGAVINNTQKVSLHAGKPASSSLFDQIVKERGIDL